MSMEVSARDKKLLVYLLAVAIIAIAYYLGARPFLDKVENLATESEQLQSEVNNLLSIYNNQESYTTRIAEEQVRFNEALQKFPSKLTQESTLMMVDDIERNTGTWISRINFTEEQLVAGNGNSDSDDIVAEAQEVTNQEYSTGDLGESVDNAISASNLSSVQQNLTLDYSCSYDNFKRFIQYISNYKDRLFISNINAAYSADTNEISGSLILTQYAVYGTGKEYVEPELSDVNLGTDNIFTTLLGTTGDYGDGLEVATLTNPDSIPAYIMMNILPAGSGENLIVVGKAGDSSEETYVKSSDNETSSVEISIDGSEGSYSVTAKMADQSKTFSVEAVNDVKLQITSSIRNGDDDKVSANINLNNNSDINMVVEIAGDDSENPRVNINEKNGNIDIR